MLVFAGGMYCKQKRHHSAWRIPKRHLQLRGCRHRTGVAAPHGDVFKASKSRFLDVKCWFFAGWENGIFCLCVLSFFFPRWKLEFLGFSTYLAKTMVLILKNLTIIRGFDRKMFIFYGFVSHPNLQIDWCSDLPKGLFWAKPWQTLEKVPNDSGVPCHLSVD